MAMTLIIILMLVAADNMVGFNIYDIFFFRACKGIGWVEDSDQHILPEFNVPGSLRCRRSVHPYFSK